jgi:hypothetical protein
MHHFCLPHTPRHRCCLKPLPAAQITARHTPPSFPCSLSVSTASKRDPKAARIENSLASEGIPQRDPLMHHPDLSPNGKVNIGSPGSAEKPRVVARTDS